MRVIENESVVFFDVDGTLALKFDNSTPEDTIRVFDPYSKEFVKRTVHVPHKKLVQNYIERGFKVYIWSKNGYRWAVEVLKALGLDESNLEVLTKPRVIVDDEPPANWIGEQAFIPANNSFGRD
jgi:hydroxymethylpyrimidine pyrophosphatase-like HAD family hydrolase